MVIVVHADGYRMNEDATLIFTAMVMGRWSSHPLPRASNRSQRCELIINKHKQGTKVPSHDRDTPEVEVEVENKDDKSSLGLGI